MTYTSNYSSTIVPYVNTGLTETGPHITQIKTALTREMNKFFREKGWIKEKEENLTGEDIQEGMYMVFNATAPGVSYDAQVKSRITAIETKPFVSAFVEALNAWLITNEKEVKGIADKALNARKAREAAKKAREAIRTGPKEKKTVLKLPSKLTDCWSKDRAKCEIFIVEGDSAGGNMKVARDNEFQAILPIRGKVLNCEKASLDKMMANAEIRDMIKAFGLDLNPKTGKVVFDKTKLRYGKIFISADADVDGSHIQSLFYTFIWNFCPELIIEGYVYATIPPLYKLTLSNGYKYIQDDAALERFKAENPGKKYSVNRLKGLGEMDADELEETLLNIDGRHYKQITVEDVAQANVLFDQLMGTSAVPRKKFIEEHSNEAEVEV
jgi:DNA gyrase subunit B